MKRNRKAQPELRPVYIRPTFDRRQQAAARAYCAAAYRGERHRPQPGDFDPLWLRLGLRMTLISSRAGWVVSNPLYDESLRRNPASDPSLPGPGWLREIYRWNRGRELVVLPQVCRALEEQDAARRTADVFDEAPAAHPTANTPPAQPSLFDMEEVAA